MDVQRLAPGLYRWTARHPAWHPGAPPGSPGDWPPDVGCVAYAADDRLVFVDPQLPTDAEAGWPALDALVEEHGPRVSVLTTIRFHGRSSAAVVERYDADRPALAAARIAGVEPIVLEGADETLVWLPRVRALACGDRVVGTAGGGVAPCPESWLEYIPGGFTVAALRDRLRPLLDLPLERVLVSHGEPVLAGGRAALARGLGEP
jgi:hypothetical protein